MWVLEDPPSTDYKVRIRVPQLVPHEIFSPFDARSGPNSLLLSQVPKILIDNVRDSISAFVFINNVHQHSDDTTPVSLSI